MANWEELKALIATNIATNHRRGISAVKLYSALDSIISNLGG